MYLSYSQSFLLISIKTFLDFNVNNYSNTTEFLKTHFVFFYCLIYFELYQNYHIRNGRSYEGVQERQID
jgi:hypothetical protein